MLIVGARQVGKSTLAKGLFPETERPSYVTLDDISALSLARSSAKTFQQGLKVDFVLESADGRVVGIECKSSSTVDQSSFNGLSALASQAGKNFYKGLVLYTGTNVLMFDENLLALPISALWEIKSGNSPESELFVS